MLMLTKTIKQYSFPFEKIKDFNFESLEKLGYEFRDTKNYFYSRENKQKTKGKLNFSTPKCEFFKHVL